MTAPRISAAALRSGRLPWLASSGHAPTWASGGSGDAQERPPDDGTSTAESPRAGRRRTTFDPRDDPYRHPDIPSAHADLRLTRRRLLGLAAGTIGAPPAVKAVAAAVGATPFEVVTGPGRIAFLVGGTTRWVVDAARFAGGARLAVNREGDGWRIELAKARLPGTRTAADLTARAFRGTFGWRLALAAPGLGIDGEVDLMAWLGGAPLAGAWRGSNPVLRADGRTVSFDRGARAALDAGWAYAVEGARLRLAGPTLVAPRGRLRLLAPADPSVLVDHDGPRLAISLEREGAAWGWRPDVDMPAGATWVWADEPFGAVHIEVVESGRGTATVAVAEAGSGQVAANLRPGSRLMTPEGAPFALAIGSLRWAMSGGAGGEDVATGHVPGTAWLAAGGLAMGLGDGAAGAARRDGPTLFPSLGSTNGDHPSNGSLSLPSSAAGFALAQRAGKRTRLRVAPALGAVVAPLEGVLATAYPSRARSSVVFAWVHDPTSQADGTAGAVEIGPVTAPAGNGSVSTAPRDAELARGRDVADAEDTGLVRIAADGALALAQLPAALDLIVIRPEDLLVLGFRFQNLTVQTIDGQRRLVPVSPTVGGRIVVHFPGQHIAERVQAEAAENVPPTLPPPLAAALAYPSRLAFDLPFGTIPAEGLPYTLATLLRWTDYVPAMRVAVPGTPSAPTITETSIEAPYRVVHVPSPQAEAAWAHRVLPGTHEGRAELWHTRLGTPGTDNAREYGGDVLADVVDETERPDLQAVWSPDYPKGQNASSDRFWSLTEADRRDIVALSGGLGTPVTANRLYLSALGAWLDLNLVAGPDNPTSLESWTHRAATGRDTFVRVVRRGWLLPFGHAASKVTVVERKFQKTPAGLLMAPLRYREFIVVREPVKAFNDRANPFRRIRLLTLVTPPLAVPAERDPLGALNVNDAFWVQVGSGASKRDLPFQILGRDWEAADVDLDAPLAWIDAVYAAQGGNQAAAVAAYNAATARRTRDMAGQKVAFAPSSGQGADPVMATASVALHAKAGGGGTFAPLLEQALVKVPQLEQLLGKGEAVAIRYFGGFVANGFGAANPGEVFAELVDTVGLDFGEGGLGDKAGGIAAPAIALGGLSRRLGLAGSDLAGLAGGSFDPLQYLQGGAKLLGHDVLKDIIEVVNFAVGGDEGVPKLTTRLDAARKGLVTTIDWTPKVKDFVPFKFDQNGTTEFVLRTELFAGLDAGGGATASFEVEGRLTHFAVGLVVIEVFFSKLTFTAGSGKAAKVDPDIAGVVFAGPLSFVNKLQELMDSSALGSGPQIELRPTGLYAGFSIGLPGVSVGVMSLENLRLSAGLDLPFTGDPMRVRFAFCERQSPFTLTVSMFGGGGFFGIALGADGVILLEAAFEFGAQVSLNLGVASGSAGVMAGIYFKIELGDAELTGYLRCWGRLSILGLIKLSLEFYLAFTYYFPTKSARGVAELKVKIEILFFSKTITLRVEREFKGGGGGGGFLLATTMGAPALPDGAARASAEDERIRFGDMIDASEWAAYCAAFAGA